MAQDTNELWSTLMRFHREVTMPEMREMLSTKVDSSLGVLRNEMNSHFDAVCARLDRLHFDFTALHGVVRRLDDRMDARSCAARH